MSMPALQAAQTMLPVSLCPAFPHHSVVHTYPDAELDDAYQALLAVWNRIADVLKRQPPGTLGFFGAHRLVMAPLDGELVLLTTPDLSIPSLSAGCRVIRAQDIQGFSRDKFADWIDRLTMWLDCPLYTIPADPQQVSECLEHQYSTGSAPYWRWDGNNPA